MLLERTIDLAAAAMPISRNDNFVGVSRLSTDRITMAPDRRRRTLCSPRAA
jgi:hypothetical protein